MAERKESVRLDLTGNFTTESVKAAAALALVNRELKDLDGTSVKASTSTRRTTTELNEVAKGANKADSSINQLTGRLRAYTDAALIAGPALSPITTAGVAGLVGLSSAAGFAVGGLGALVLGFQGVGDTLEAVNTAAVEPTAANLAAARAQMDALDPAAQSLVLRLSELKEVGAGLRDTAASGVLPGVEDALDSLEARVPTATRLLDTFATATGDAIARTGDSLAGGRYQDFFDYLDAEAPASIATTTTVLGNLASAGTEVFEAFAPLSRDLLDGLARGTERLDAAASGLEGSEGMRDFIDYVRDTGPQVVDTTLALGGALIDIGTAAAPLGGPVLAAIEAVSGLVSSVAESDVGTPFIAGTAAVLAYQRALSAAEGLQRRVMGATGASASRTDRVSGARLGDLLGTTELRKSLPTLQQAGTYVYRLGQSADQATPSTLKARDAVRGFAREAAGSNLAKGAAGIAALTVATSGAADGLGLSNTAALGLAGTMAGPVGAAVGIVAGGFLDIRATASGVNDAVRDLDRVFGSSASTVDDFAAQLTKSRDTIAATRADLYDVTGVGDFFGDALASVNLQASGIGGDNYLEKGRADQREKAADYRDLAGALYEVNTQLGGTPVAAGVAADGISNTYENLDRMRQIADQADPALDALGISLAQLAANPERVGDVVTKMREIDSSSGRIAAVAQAVAGLDNELLSTVDSASAFSAALDGLLSPGLNLSAATDQLRGGLRDLNVDLAENNRSLRGNTSAADQNRAAIRQQVTNITEYLGAQAAAGASADALSRNLRRQRGALLDAGEAAGLSRGQVRSYINQLGLTPAVVSTLVKAETGGAIAALNAIRAYQIPDKSFTVTQYTNARLADAKVSGGPPKKQADGGTVPYTGLGYADRHPYLLADLEEVVSNRYGQADAFRPVLKAINRNASRSEVRGMLADGGTVGDNPGDLDDDDAKKAPTAAQRRAAAKRSAERARDRRQAVRRLQNLAPDLTSDDPLGGFIDDLQNVRAAFKDAGLKWSGQLDKQTQSLRASTAAHDKAAEALAKTAEAANQLSSDVAGSINNDLFGNGLAGLNTQLAADANDNAALRTALEDAVANGLATVDNKATAYDESAFYRQLAASGDVTTVQQLAASGRGGIDATEAAYANRYTQQQALAGTARDRVYGAELKTQTAAVERATRETANMRKDLARLADRLPAAVERGSTRGTREGTSAWEKEKKQKTGQNTQTGGRGGRRNGGRGR